MRLRFGVLALLLISLLVITGCQPQSTAEKSIKPAQVKVTENVVINQQLNLIKDPVDPNIKYYLEFNNRDQEAQQVIEGPYWRGVSLLKVGKDGREKVVIPDLPFITRARWSPNGYYLGLMGAEKLYLWERATGKVTLVNQAVNTPSITHFAFGPDNQVYTEHANLPNDAIYDPLSRQGHPAYEISGRPLYYKEDLGDGFYAGTVVKDGSKTAAEEVYTVIADAKGNIVKPVMSGRYRDHSGSALLNVGINHFGLYYVADFNQPRPREIYSGYVYQCNLAADGSVIYTRPGSKEHPYYLCKYQPRTNKTLEVPISGSFFAADTVANMIFGSGWEAEQIDLGALTTKSRLTLPATANADIKTALLGAVSTYTELYCQPLADKEARRKLLAEWYVDTNQPVKQWALSDVTEEMSARSRWASSYYGDYLLAARIEQLEVKGERASAVLGQGVSTASGSGWANEAAYELVKTSAGWRVTGISTFPTSGERRRVESVVGQFTKKAKQGATVNFTMPDSPRAYQELRGKPIQVGQIQFWRMSEPHKSPNIETANHAKVYLIANGKTYRLLLAKKSFAWQVTGLSDQNLGGLL